MPCPEQNASEEAFCAAQEGHLPVPLPSASAGASEHTASFLEPAKINDDQLWEITSGRLRYLEQTSTL